MAIDRAAFIKRIADALIRGERKLGRVLTPMRAYDQARHVAAALPELFTDETKASER